MKSSSYKVPFVMAYNTILCVYSRDSLLLLLGFWIKIHFRNKEEKQKNTLIML
jgi:hypothetical protein